MDKELEEYSKFINNCLSNLGITRSEAGKMFARIAGIPEETGKDLIYRYCQGTRRPGRGNAIFLAEMLGLSVDEVLNGKKSVSITPTLRTTFKQRGYTLERYIEKLNKVVEFSTPLTNHDEFGKDALDYAIENKNNDAIKYLIKHNICEYDNLYTEITHSCRDKGNIKLRDLFDIALGNNDEELLEIIYPKANKYVLVSDEEESELYVTKLLKKDMKYFLFENDSINNVFVALKNHFLDSYNLDEKIFERRNKTLLKNKELMRLSSFNMHTNILVNYAGKQMLPMFFDYANYFNSLLIDSLYKIGVTSNQLEIGENGALYYLLNNKRYWISTLAFICESREADAFEIAPKQYLEYKQFLDIDRYMKNLNEYYDNYDSIIKNEYDFSYKLTFENFVLLISNLIGDKNSKISYKEDDENYCAIIDEKEYIIVDKKTYEYIRETKLNHEQEIMVKQMNECK